MQKTLLISMLLLFSVGSLFGQDMKVSYQGGYFTRQGKTWNEYRPQDRSGVWNTFTEYHEDANFWYLDNGYCKLAMPKRKDYNIQIQYKDRNDWAYKYTTTNVERLGNTPPTSSPDVVLPGYGQYPNSSSSIYLSWKNSQGGMIQYSFWITPDGTQLCDAHLITMGVHMYKCVDSSGSWFTFRSHALAGNSFTGITWVPSGNFTMRISKDWRTVVDHTGTTYDIPINNDEYNRWKQAADNLARIAGGGNAPDREEQSTEKRERSKSGYRPSRVTCPVCHGRCYQSQDYTYAPASNASGWMGNFHYRVGDPSCPYCNRATEHWHYPCNECHGYGKVKP